MSLETTEPPALLLKPAEAAKVGAKNESVWKTPPQLAKMLGIEPPKVIGWIKRGELRAVNVADRTGGRPRWRISPDAVENFLRVRESKAPPPKATRQRRQRQPADFIEFV